MKLIKVEALIEIDENMFPLNDSEDINWFVEIMKDKENTNLQIWSNDIGDEICSTNNFKWSILTELNIK